MRKYLSAFAVVTLSSLAIVAPAGAADIANLSGQGCPDGSVGNYHFVNNQTGGAPAGTLTATFSDGSVYVVGASKVLSSTQHFNVLGAAGTLTGATTGTLPGKLVLSDFSCTDVKKK